MAEEKNWVVTLSGDRPAGEVRKDLAEAGFAVDQLLGEIGVITGRCSDRARPVSSGTAPRRPGG